MPVCREVRNLCSEGAAKCPLVIFSVAVDAGTLTKEPAAKAGIEINLIREPNDAYWDNVWLKKLRCFSSDIPIIAQNYDVDENHPKMVVSVTIGLEREHRWVP